VADRALKTTLGKQLRAVRLARGLTQEQLAEQLDVTPRYLAGIERGERNLSLDSVDALAEQLGVHPSLVLDAT
jgi:transcriptional regulator with XRE-family HTH domain